MTVAVLKSCQQSNERGSDRLSERLDRDAVIQIFTPWSTFKHLIRLRCFTKAEHRLCPHIPPINANLPRVNPYFPRVCKEGWRPHSRISRFTLHMPPRDFIFHFETPFYPGIPAFLRFLPPVLIGLAGRGDGLRSSADRAPFATAENNDPDCFKCPKEIMEVH